MKKESEIQREIRLSIGQRDDVVIFRNNVGLARDEKSGRYIPFGLCKGSSDLIGIMVGSGRFVALEVKTAKGRPSKEQKLFLALIERIGGVAAIVRSEEEANAVIDDAKRSNGNNELMSFDEIGSSLDPPLTGERVRQIYNDGLAKLRTYFERRGITNGDILPDDVH